MNAQTLDALPSLSTRPAHYHPVFIIYITYISLWLHMAWWYFRFHSSVGWRKHSEHRFHTHCHSYIQIYYSQEQFQRRCSSNVLNSGNANSSSVLLCKGTISKVAGTIHVKGIHDSFYRGIPGAVFSLLSQSLKTVLSSFLGCNIEKLLLSW